MRALLATSVLLLASNADAQSVCSAHTPGGVLVTEGRGGMGARLVANTSHVGVAWTESSRLDENFGPSGNGVSYYARAFAAPALTPTGSARELFHQSAPYEVPMGPLALSRSDGGLRTLHCVCVGGAARFNCTLADLVTGASAERIRPENRQTSVCPIGALSAATLGTDVLAAVPFPDAAGIRMHGTAVGALQDVELANEVQVPTMAAVGTDRVAFFQRTNDTIEARLFDVRGNTRGRPTVLSAPRTTVGTPFALSQGNTVWVVFAQRSGRAPWRLQLVQWTPGSAPTRTEINTGTAPAMGPSLAPAAGNCLVLSWTEGTGRNTVARAGRVCNGALEASSVAQLSQPGVEAGDSEVVSNGTDVFAVWQELPAARGARAELRLARLGCH